MVPIMVDAGKEYVISFDVTTEKISVRNPYGNGYDGNYELLKKLLDNLAGHGNPITKDKLNELYTNYCQEHPADRVVYIHFVDAIFIAINNYLSKPTLPIDFEDNQKSQENLILPEKTKEPWVHPVKSSVTYREVLEMEESYLKLNRLGYNISDDPVYKVIRLIADKFRKEVEEISKD